MDLANIKVTATNGQGYHTLTDFEGNFEFYMPNGSYTVSIDEAILGSKYKLAKNDILVYLSQGVEGVFITFYIIERKRKVNRQAFHEFLFYGNTIGQNTLFNDVKKLHQGTYLAFDTNGATTES